MQAPQFTPGTATRLERREMLSGRDNRKMIDFITRYLPDGYGRLVLAEGAEGDDITAEVTVCGDHLEIESNCPEWVSVREVYDHLRWKAMPAWEQWKWLRPERAKADNRMAPYRFQKIGRLWSVHFPVDGEIKCGFFPDHVGIRHFGRLLAAPHRTIESLELAGKTDPQILELIAAERHFVGQKRNDNLSVQKYQQARDYLKDKLDTAKESGDLMEMERLEEQLDRLDNELWPGKEMGATLTTLRRQQMGKAKIELTIHKSVGTAMRRTVETLNDAGMGELARFLEMSVNPDGYGFAYRPLAPEPDWLL